MPTIRTASAALLALCLSASLASAESKNAAVEAGELDEHIRYLASDALEGRGTGTKGERLAGDYLAKELARFGIRTGAIAPGFVGTEMVMSMKPEALEMMTKGIPAKRVGTPDEIAQAVAFILENDYFSGRVIEIEVDGALRL